MLVGAVSGVGEAGFYVRESGKVKGHGEVRDNHIELGYGTDAAFALEGFSAEVGAVGEVEDGIWVFRTAAEG